MRLPALALLLAGLAADGAPVDESLAAFKAGDYGRSAELAAKVTAEDPAWAKARYLLGEARLALGDAPGAETAFRESLAKRADAVPALSGLGRALQAKGSREEALQTLQKAVKLDGKDAGARRSLGEVLAAQGKIPEGRKEIEQAVKLDPKDPLSARALVEILVKQQDEAGSTRAAGQFLAADPKSPVGHFLKALVLDRFGKDREAIAAYETALEKDPAYIDAHKNLAILCVAKNPSYQDRERTQKAMVHFAKYFELGGKDEELQRTYETIKSFVGGRSGK